MNVTQPRTPVPASPASYRVVVGSDFSDLGDRAVLEAMRLCSPYASAELHVIVVGASSAGGVILPGPDTRPHAESDARELARTHVARLSDHYFTIGQCPGLQKIAVYVTHGSPAERIVALAAAVDADVIVVGTHGRRGLSRVVLGSVAKEVMSRAPCGVFVLRPRDFLDGEKLPEIQPPLQPGEHPLQPFRESVTYHYIDRLNLPTQHIMPAI